MPMSRDQASVLPVTPLKEHFYPTYWDVPEPASKNSSNNFISSMLFLDHARPAQRAGSRVVDQKKWVITLRDLGHVSNSGTKVVI